MQNKATQIRVSFNNDILTALIRVAKSLDMTNAALIKSIVAQDKRIIREINRINAPPEKERASGYVSVKRQHKLRVEKEREDKAEQLRIARLAAQERHAAIAAKDLLAEMAKLDDEDQQHDEDMKDL